MLFTSYQMRYELSWWETGMSLNGGSFLICTIQASWSSSAIKVFVSTVASVCTVRSRASGGCERGEAVPTETHCSGGIVSDLAQQIWWIVAIVRMFWSIWKKLWTKQWPTMDSAMMHICNMLQSAACAWNPYSIHVFPLMRWLECSAYPHSTEKRMKREPVCLEAWVCFFLCMCVCLIKFVIHIQK